VTRLAAYDDLSETLEEERKALEHRWDALKKFLMESGYEGEDLKADVIQCVKDIIEIEEIQASSGNLEYPLSAIPVFDELWQSNRLQEEREQWGTSLNQATQVLEDPKVMKILCFNPEPLERAYNDLIRKAARRIIALDEEMSALMNAGEEGSGGATKDELLTELDLIAKILDAPSEDNEED